MAEFRKKRSKKAAKRSNTAQDLLGILEDRIGINYHWKHGGIVGVKGYGGGVIGRYSDIPGDFPGVEHFPHPARQSAGRLVLRPQGPARSVRHLGQVGSGLTNFTAPRAIVMLLGTSTDQLSPLC